MLRSAHNTPSLSKLSLLLVVFLLASAFMGINSQGYLSDSPAKGDNYLTAVSQAAEFPVVLTPQTKQFYLDARGASSFHFVQQAFFPHYFSFSRQIDNGLCHILDKVITCPSILSRIFPINIQPNAP